MRKMDQRQSNEHLYSGFQTRAWILTMLILATLGIQADEDNTLQRLPLIDNSGTYSRPISTANPTTQAYFDQGLRFAWGFYFPEAIASYQTASELDPTHPMPYWGLAHAMGPNPNSRYARMPDDPKGEGAKAIAAAVARIARATPKEAKLITALEKLYDQAQRPSAQDRDTAYLAAMRDLNQQYPTDPDIAALYAGAYMSIQRWDYWDSEGNPKSETAEVAAALEGVIATGIQHPGVFHLHIHLIEASRAPERALVSANALEATMPIAGHVVHMPAHIFVRTGDFQRAITNNQRALAVDQTLKAIWGDHPLPNLGTYPLSHRIHAPHAIDFIRYAATVQGNYQTAIEAAEQTLSLLPKSAARNPRHQKQIAAPWLVHKIFGQWSRVLEIKRPAEGAPYLSGMWAYTQGSARIAQKAFSQAREHLAQLEALVELSRRDTGQAGATPNARILELAALSLRGELLEATGDLDGAIKAFEAGVALEDLNNYTEPPDWPQPLRHYLGAALLKANRAADAEAVYRRDLQWNHNNGWSLLGLQQALLAQGKTEAAKVVETAFDTAWQYSNITLERSHL
jgi:tetratricopeptide (TPR) repeat protein